MSLTNTTSHQYPSISAVEMIQTHQTQNQQQLCQLFMSGMLATKSVLKVTLSAVAVLVANWHQLDSNAFSGKSPHEPLSIFSEIINNHKRVDHASRLSSEDFGTKGRLGQKAHHLVSERQSICLPHSIHPYHE